MAQFDTSTYAQMRRCRMAQLYGERVDERFGEDTRAGNANGYVHAVRPDLTSRPMRWTITIKPHPVETRAMAMAS